MMDVTVVLKHDQIASITPSATTKQEHGITVVNARRIVAVIANGKRLSRSDSMR